MWHRARCFLHGSLGATNEMPFVEQVIQSFHMGLADGPTEVHKITVARQILREYKATDGSVPEPAHSEAARSGDPEVRRAMIEHEVHALTHKVREIDCRHSTPLPKGGGRSDALK